jgi:hypothetical protein
MILLGGIPLWWAVDALLTRSPVLQLAVLGAYGVAGMSWVMIRTRRILRTRLPGHTGPMIDCIMRDGVSPSSAPSGHGCAPLATLSPKGEGQAERPTAADV